MRACHYCAPAGSPSLYSFLTRRQPPTSPLFPYTTLFRSLHAGPIVQAHNRIHTIHVADSKRVRITSGDHTFDFHFLTAGHGTRAGGAGCILSQDWGG